MTTPAGEMVASVILATSQYERRMIGIRTREAPAAKKAAGMRLGRPTQLPEHVPNRIVRERAEGLSLAKIAAASERTAYRPPAADSGRKPLCTPLTDQRP